MKRAMPQGWEHRRSSVASNEATRIDRVSAVLLRVLILILLSATQGLGLRVRKELPRSPAFIGWLSHGSCSIPSSVKVHGQALVASSRNHVLDGEFDWDVERFEEALRSANGLPKGSAERAKAYEIAMDGYRGPFAEAFFSEWASAVRHRVSERADEAVSTLAGYYAAQNDFEAAANCMQRVLTSNQLNEEAAYRFADYRSKAGNAAAALEFLDDYRRIYLEEVGGELPERFRRLRTQIAGGQAG